jgi:hypothetical protein
MIHEADVALTDFALAIECAILAYLLHRMDAPAQTLRKLFVTFFAAAGVASLLGGITHGFLVDHQSVPYRVVWNATLIAIGCAAYTCWAAGARLWLSRTAAARVATFAAVLLALDIVVILFVSQNFLVAIVHYLPAAVFLLVSFALAYRERPTPYLRAGILGVLLTFVAAAVQQLGPDLDPDYFDRNALYHVVQGIALILILIAVRGVLRAPPHLAN